jgi:hypothetical protein
MLWAKKLTNITSSNLTLTITYTDQDGLNPNTATVMIPKDTPKGTYFPVPLEQGDSLVKDVTNITGPGGGTGNAVLIEGKGTRILPDWKLQPPKGIGKDYRKLLNHAVIKGKGNLKTQTLGDTPLLDTTGITSNEFYVNPHTSADYEELPEGHDIEPNCRRQDRKREIARVLMPARRSG